MRITNETIDRAFARHREVYASVKGWDIQHRIDCWANAVAAFDQGSLPDFERLYRNLKGGWQVFRRSAGTPPSAPDTFQRLRALDPAFRRLRLSALDGDRIGECWHLINSISDIKPMKGAPSVVAISKFLHFWNPGLFVIVDDAVMWKVVFGRSWLKAMINDEKARVQAHLPEATCMASDSCDLLEYLAVLRWSARVLCLNPSIPQRFERYVCAKAEYNLRALPLVEYEAAAVEWLLLGLAELPPEGVDLA